MADRSLAALTEFLDYLSSKGLMNRETASSRRIASAKVLGVLAPEEQTDVIAVDLDDAMARFVNLEGKKYTPNSLSVYRSRVASAISDFRSYLDNPQGFKPSATSKKPPKAAGAPKPPKKLAVTKVFAGTPRPEPSTQNTNVFPIPLRADLVVRIHGLPFDLTAEEAEKIANVVKALGAS